MQEVAAQCSEVSAIGGLRATLAIALTVGMCRRSTSVHNSVTTSEMSTQ